SSQIREPKKMSVAKPFSDKDNVEIWLGSSDEEEVEDTWSDENVEIPAPKSTKVNEKKSLPRAIPSSLSQREELRTKRETEENAYLTSVMKASRPVLTGDDFDIANLVIDSPSEKNAKMPLIPFED